jgi:hypothetical protein
MGDGPTVFPPYRPTALLPYCPIALCPIALLPYCSIALLPYCPTALLPFPPSDRYVQLPEEEQEFVGQVLDLLTDGQGPDVPRLRVIAE